ncbi:MAG TPA: molybdopterin dinucleotide binding domain-containing protein, partial [Gemmataceae bacterium]|nr:molybdopterin dinucleotide binding domain-containing protein [Gemmataceae bacterium]
HYVPPHEDPQMRPDLAAKYPLQLVTPPDPAFLNSSFVNVDVLRKAAGEPTVQIHPEDAAKRRIKDGQPVTVFNGRGQFTAKAAVGKTVRPGVAVALGVWWSKYVGGPNCNATTSTATTDLGAGGTFFDNLVEVSAAMPGPQN